MRATCFSQSQTELSFASQLPVRLPAGGTDVLALPHNPVYFHSSWLGAACPCLCLCPSTAVAPQQSGTEPIKWAEGAQAWFGGCMRVTGLSVAVWRYSRKYPFFFSLYVLNLVIFIYSLLLYLEIVSFGTSFSVIPVVFSYIFNFYLSFAG